MDYPHELIGAQPRLRELLNPILTGQVTLAAFDTETTEVKDGRFTPWGTSTRIAGFSVAYTLDGEDVSFYVPIRHVAYDWRRRQDLIEGDTNNAGPAWIQRLTDVERVLGPDAEEPGFHPGMDPNLDAEAALKDLKRALAVDTCRWIAHNWPFDAKQLQADDIDPPWGRMEDTQALSVFTDERPLDVWDEDANTWAHGGHSLKHLGEKYLGIDPEAQSLLKEAQSALGAGGRKLMDYSMLPLRTAIAPYGSMDTYLCLRLFTQMLTRPAAKDSRVMELYRKHVDEVEVSTGMERLGIGVNVDAVPAAVAEAEKGVADTVTEVTRLAGRPMPLNNGKELSNILYSELGLPTYRGLRNTRQATLKQVRQRLATGEDVPVGGQITAENAVELIDAIQAYRKQDKLLTAFYRPLGGFTAEGRVHCILSPLAAKTTRYSASSPNMQQAPKPKKGFEQLSPRRLFVPSDGHQFLFLDYSQIELRVAAHYAMSIPESFKYVFSWKCTLERRGDCKGKGAHGPGEVHYGWRANYSTRPVKCGLFDGFMTGDTAFDPHQAMADASGRDRDMAKGANFALLYGAFPNKLAETLDITPAEARKLFDTFWKDAYPELGHLRTFVDERLRKHGELTKFSGQEYLTTLHGGRIYLDGGYKGLNYIVQRSSREILLNALLELNEFLEAKAPEYRLVMPIHDEVVLEVPKDSMDQDVVRNIAQIMVAAGSASKVPMVVEPEMALKDWAHKEPLKGWGWNGVKMEAL